MPRGVSLRGHRHGPVTVHPPGPRPFKAVSVYIPTESGWVSDSEPFGDRLCGDDWKHFCEAPRAIIGTGSEWSYGGLRGEGSSTIIDAVAISDEMLGGMGSLGFLFGQILAVESETCYLLGEFRASRFIKDFIREIVAGYSTLGRVLWLDFGWRSKEFRWIWFDRYSSVALSTGSYALTAEEWAGMQLEEPDLEYWTRALMSGIGRGSMGDNPLDIVMDSIPPRYSVKDEHAIRHQIIIRHGPSATAFDKGVTPRGFADWTPVEDAKWAELFSTEIIPEPSESGRIRMVSVNQTPRNHLRED